VTDIDVRAESSTLLTPVTRWAKEIRDRARRWPIQLWILTAVISVFVVATLALSWLRYLTFHTNAWDIGILQQALWTASHQGKLLYYTAELPWNTSGSFLGTHWSPILFLIVPVYAVWPGAFTLMLIQCLILGASAYPLYGLAVRRVSPWIALLLASLYLASPPLLGGLLYDFHVESFIPLTALTTIYAWETGRRRLGVAAGALLVCTVEFAPLILGAIALSRFLGRVWTAWRVEKSVGFLGAVRRNWIPLLVVLAALPLTLLWYALAKSISPSTPPISQIGPLGGSIEAILLSLFTHPSLVYQSLVSEGPHKVAYAISLVLCGIVLWLLAPLDLLPAVPWLLVVFVSADPSYSDVAGTQYQFLVIPFVFVAAAAGIAKVVDPQGWIRSHGRRWAERLRRTGTGAVSRGDRSRRPAAERALGRQRAHAIGGWAVFAVVVIASQVLYSPASPLTDYSWLGTGDLPTAQDRAVDQVLGLIPANASVSAEPDLFPQVADRGNSYPYYEAGTQFLVLNVESFWFTAAMPPPDPPLIWYDELRENVTLPYGVYASLDGAVLYELGYEGVPVLYSPFNATVSPGSLELHLAKYVVSSTAPLGSYLEPNPLPSLASLWSGPYQVLPPGHYSVVSWVRPVVGENGSLKLSVTADDGVTILDSRILASGALGAGWSTIQQNFSIAYPTYIEVTGTGTGAIPAVEFGGALVTELSGKIVLG
jgi:uncharacterized membrane protein